MVKNLPANAGVPGDKGFIPELGRSLGVGNGNALQYSCLENSMDRGAWWVIVHGVTKSWTEQLSAHMHKHKCHQFHSNGIDIMILSKLHLGQLLVWERKVNAHSKARGEEMSSLIVRVQLERQLAGMSSWLPPPAFYPFVTDFYNFIWPPGMKCALNCQPGV